MEAEEAAKPVGKEAQHQESQADSKFAIEIQTGLLYRVDLVSKRRRYCEDHEEAEACDVEDEEEEKLVVIEAQQTRSVP